MPIKNSSASSRSSICSKAVDKKVEQVFNLFIPAPPNKPTGYKPVPLYFRTPRHASSPQRPNPNAFSVPWIIHICGIVSAQSGTTCRKPNPIAKIIAANSEAPETTKPVRVSIEFCFSIPRRICKNATPSAPSTKTVTPNGSTNRSTPKCVHVIPAATSGTPSKIATHENRVQHPGLAFAFSPAIKGSVNPA